MSSNGKDWVRCTKALRCPICDRDHYCCISRDKTAALCTKVESDKPAGNSGGWIHKLTEDTRPKYIPKPKPKQPPIPKEQIAKLAVEDFNRCDHPEMLSNSLGLSVASMRECGLGYDGRCWTCPEFDAQRRIIGIELRPPAGHKFMLTGSSRGLTWPKDIGKKLDQPLLICEGWSDAVGAGDLTFDVLGRPNCSAIPEMILEALRTRLRYRQVWIFADNDPIDPKTGKRAGLHGAKALASMLVKIKRHVKILYAPQDKDLRKWVNAGATRTVIENLARNREFFKESP